MNLFAYWNSDKVLLSMYGARQVDAGTAPDLVHIVERLAAQARLPMPKVYITGKAHLSDPDKVPVSGPEAVGENVTWTVHDAPAARDDGQLVLLAKSPLAMIDVTLTAEAL